jgi:hypothetical protein
MSTKAARYRRALVLLTFDASAARLAADRRGAEGTA